MSTDKPTESILDVHVHKTLIQKLQNLALGIKEEKKKKKKKKENNIKLALKQDLQKNMDSQQNHLSENEDHPYRQIQTDVSTVASPEKKITRNRANSLGSHPLIYDIMDLKNDILQQQNSITSSLNGYNHLEEEGKNKSKNRYQKEGDLFIVENDGNESKDIMKTKKKASLCTRSYYVKTNETLVSIGVKYGISPSTIKMLNKLSTDYIYSGQKLLIFRKPNGDKESSEDENTKDVCQEKEAVAIISRFYDKLGRKSYPYSRVGSNDFLHTTASIEDDKCNVYEDTLSSGAGHHMACYVCPPNMMRGYVTVLPATFVFDPFLSIGLIKEGRQQQHRIELKLREVMDQAILTEDDFKLVSSEKISMANKSYSSVEIRKTWKIDLFRDVAVNTIEGVLPSSVVNESSGLPEETTYEFLRVGCKDKQYFFKMRKQDIEITYQWLAYYTSNFSISDTPRCEKKIYLPTEIPKLKCKRYDLLRLDYIMKLTPGLPPSLHICTLDIIYSTYKHGSSLNTLYRKVLSYNGPTLMLIEDSNKNLFGCFANYPWHRFTGLRGTGHCFLFTLKPELKVFRWKHRNECFMIGESHYLAMGVGDSHFGLYLDESLGSGSSARCSTFDNDPLSSTPEFNILGVEVWGFFDP